MTAPLRFHGNSDDTFGEYGRTMDDFDNCNDGTSIDWAVVDPMGDGVLVSGRYSEKGNGARTCSRSPRTTWPRQPASGGGAP